MKDTRHLPHRSLFFLHETLRERICFFRLGRSPLDDAWHQHPVTHAMDFLFIRWDDGG